MHMNSSLLEDPTYAALLKYGQHTEGCTILLLTDPDKPCSCGFQEALFEPWGGKVPPVVHIRAQGGSALMYDPHDSLVREMLADNPDIVNRFVELSFSDRADFLETVMELFSPIKQANGKLLLGALCREIAVRTQVRDFYRKHSKMRNRFSKTISEE